MRAIATLLGTLAISACAWIQPMPPQAPAIPETATPLSWSEVLAMPQVPGGKTLSYGPAAEQFGVLRHPGTAKPAPVIVLIHGGCWLNAFDFKYFEHWAQWLSERGYATWNIEYRRLGDSGGGWPGTLLDVADALDFLHGIAEAEKLDLSTVTLIGHSAGGQLALWSASRQALPTDSELYRGGALAVSQVIGLAAITDLQTYRIGPANSCHASVDALLGGSPEQHPQRFLHSSPAQRVPLGVKQSLISGDLDGIVAPDTVSAYAQHARQAGDDVNVIELPGAGHFDVGVPTPASIVAMTHALGL